MSFESALPASFEIYLNFWRTIRGDSNVPALTDLFDQPDGRIHPWLNIVDVETANSQSIRFAGTAVVDYFGKDLTRTNFLEILSPQARPILQEAHRQVPRVPCGAFHKATAATSTGLAFDLLALALPFRRSNNLPCVAWRLETHATRGFAEGYVHVIDVSAWRWIDLGNGVPI